MVASRQQLGSRTVLISCSQLKRLQWIHNKSSIVKRRPFGSHFISLVDEIRLLLAESGFLYPAPNDMHAHHLTYTYEEQNAAGSPVL